MRKIGFIFLLVFLFIAVSTLFVCNRIIITSVKGRLYSDIDSIPFRQTGLLLGTSKFANRGNINPFYQYRIAAAVQLIRNGKIRYIIVSGDNGRKDYDEPSQMRADLIAAGVDSTHIFPDYAGFRTFDSMVRAKKIFGQDSLTIISQPFHNERALYIASREGIGAIAFNAQNVSGHTGFFTSVREYFARVKVFVDYGIRKGPKYLGEKVQIG